MIEKVKNMNKFILFYNCLWFLLCLFFVYGCMFSEGSKQTIKGLFAIKENYYIPLFFIAYVLFFLLCILSYHILENMTNNTLIFILFIIAFIPRLILALLHQYIPTSDFDYYVKLGNYFIIGDFKEIAEIVNIYQLPSYGGLAVFNGIFVYIFSTSITGFQLAHSVITSLICIVLYKLIEYIDSKRSAIIGCLVFSIYPGNIISTQVTTNQHGAILFYLLTFLFTLKAINEYKIIYAFFAGIFLVIGRYFHPSYIIILLALTFYIMTIAIYEFNTIKFKYYIKLYITILLTTFILYTIFNFILLNIGIINDTHEITMLLKVVFGLNKETNGRYSSNDNILMKASNDQINTAISLIKDRIVPLKELFKLFIKKIDFMWFMSDNIFRFYTTGDINKFRQLNINDINYSFLEYTYNKFVNTVSAYSNFDMVYCLLMYLFALIGIINNINKSFKNIGLITWSLLGWIGVHIIIEVQSRYRYWGIVNIVILSSIGINTIINLKEKLSTKKNGKFISNE